MLHGGCEEHKVHGRNLLVVFLKLGLEDVLEMINSLDFQESSVVTLTLSDEGGK
jgi:hypothetical protein